MSRDPLRVEVVRGGLVESVHLVDLVVLDQQGRPVERRGSTESAMYGRSSLKPLQATALVEAGLRLPPEGLALAAASHSGEDRQVELVRRTLAAAGLNETDLENTPDLPLGDGARLAAVRNGRTAESIVQNCSGKHAAMLTTCVLQGWPTRGYLDPEHPLQRAVRSGVEELIGAPARGLTVDGCGAPLLACSLQELALGFHRVMTAPPEGSAGAVRSAMQHHPDLVGGEGRDVTMVMRQLPGCVAKDGAEGVYALALPDGSALALKVHDGAARARAAALRAGLRLMGIEPPQALHAEDVLGGGRPVGKIRLGT